MLSLPIRHGFPFAVCGKSGSSTSEEGDVIPILSPVSAPGHFELLSFHGCVSPEVRPFA